MRIFVYQATKLDKKKQKAPKCLPSICSGLRAFDAEEEIESDCRQGFHGGVGILEVGEGICGGDGEGGHAGAAGGFESEVGILDHEAIGGGHVKLLCSEEKDVGSGFAMGDIIAAGYGVEKIGKASQRKDGVKVGPRGRGSNRAGNPSCAKGREEFACSREDVDTTGLNEFAVDLFLAIRE